MEVYQVEEEHVEFIGKNHVTISLKNHIQRGLCLNKHEKGGVPLVVGSYEFWFLNLVNVQEEGLLLHRGELFEIRILKADGEL